MAKPLKQWIEEDLPSLRKQQKNGLEGFFFRDPMRPMIQDADYFFSPADGVILYAEETDGEKLFDIKGRAYRIQDLCQTVLDGPMIVIGIFMHQYAVHVNRIPSSGYLRYKSLPPIKTKNAPMLDEEDDIFGGRIDRNHLGYLFDNGRMLNSVISPKFEFTYHIVQIADFDVNTITPFNTNQNIPVRQNDRFSMIRWGSQVDLVVPVVPTFDYEILVQPKFHVEGAVDRLIHITKNENPPQKRDTRFDILRRESTK